MSDSSLNQFLLSQNFRVGSDIDSWFKNTGGRALPIAVNKPEYIITAIKNSGLSGYGGSGFPTYKKLQLIKNTVSSKKYLVCNGNEDEPGAVKDELLIRETPYQLIEGAVIIALACDINSIIFYINKNYIECINTLEVAIIKWKQSELFKSLSSDIDIRLIKSKGTYVSGEETAAIEAIEDKFPLPRDKPPYPMQKGIHGQPTLINNIETLCNVPHIINCSGAYSLTKLYTLCGDINRSGVFELPLGISLYELIHNYGNGISENTDFQAVIIGGESCIDISENSKSIKLDYANDNVLSLGSAVIRVINKEDSLIALIHEYMLFYADESCGQCPACKLGSQSILKIFDRRPIKKHDEKLILKLVQLSEILTNSGKCHLIDSVANLLKSSLCNFPQQYKDSF